MPALRHAGYLNEFRDAQFLFAYDVTAVESVLRYGQFPLWNPYYCGGLYALGAPQVSFVSPTFFLSLLFGPARALSMTAFVMTVLGMEGLFRWLRLHTGSALGPALFAPTLGLNGLFACAYHHGWTHFYGFALVAWVLWGVRVAMRRDSRGLVAALLGFSWMIGFGGTYAPLYTALFVGLEAILSVGLRPRAWRQPVERAGWLVAVAALCVGVSAFRLWPLLETMASARRVMAGSPGQSLSALAQAAFSTAGATRGDVQATGSYYFGVWALPLVLLGATRRRRWAAVALLALGLWTATGYAYGSSPFVWLRELPLFDAVRYPERFLFFACLYGGVLGAGGVDLLVRVARRHRVGTAGVAMALCLVGATAVDGTVNYRTLLEGMWLGEPPASVRQPFAQSRGNRWLTSHVRALNRGTLSCYEAYPVAQSARLRGDLQQEEYLIDPAAGRVARRFWSPNRLELDVRLTKPTRVLVNQNYHPGWRVNVGTVVSVQGLLAVDLPSGAHSLTLAFLPRSALGGLGTSAVALAALLVLCSRLSRGRGLWGRRELPWTLLLTMGPLGVPALAHLLIPEPSLPRPELMNADGTPVLVTGLPEGVTVIGAAFAQPVRLEAARLPRQLDADGIAFFELYWRVTGPVPRSVGVFVHLVDPNTGRYVNADHELVGASLFFRDAPRGQLLRDAFAVNMAEVQDGPWQVHAGLWHPSGGGERVPLEPGAGAPVSEDRVWIGTFDSRGTERSAK